MNANRLFTSAPRLLLAAALIASLALVALLVPTARAASIGVTTTADDTAVDGNCTLREAIIAANSDTAVDACQAGSGADTISLPAGTYTLSIAGTNEEGALTGDLDILGDLTIAGAGALSTTIDGGGIDRVFEIYVGTLTIKNLTITSGNSTFQAGSGILVYAPGTALTLTNSRVLNNTGGAGIQANDSTTLTISGSLINNNTGGGGIDAGSGTTTILNSVIARNTSDGAGGGISSNGTLTIVNSTIGENSAASAGGGLRNAGKAELYNVTIARNTADTTTSNGSLGGGIESTLGSLTIQNSIISGNDDLTTNSRRSPDCAGTLNSAGYNLIQNTKGCTISGDTTGNLTGQAARLGALGNNGGATLTYALLAGSPALDAGSPGGCLDQNGATLATDQRGSSRTGRCDMGAYEAGALSTATPTATRTSTPTATSASAPTSTPTATRTNTPTPTLGGIDPPPATATPTRTSTPTNTPTSTPGGIDSPPATATPTRTSMPTGTPGGIDSPPITPTGVGNAPGLQLFLPVISREEASGIDR
jgi:CSLREA domain-containing protein